MRTPKLRKNELAFLSGCDDKARTGMEIADRCGLVGLRAIDQALTSLYSKKLVGAIDYDPIRYAITDAGREALHAARPTGEQER